MRPPAVTLRADASKTRATLAVLDLLAEDDRLNVHAGELEVRPPAAPTIEPTQDRY